MATITFNKPDRRIEVDSLVRPIVVTVQELVDGIRDYESELVNMELPRIATITGKDNLGGGAYTGITLLLHGWTVRFADHQGPDFTWARVTGGNLLAVDEEGAAVSAFTPSAFTSIQYAASTAASILDVSTQNPWALPTTGNQESGTMGGSMKGLEDNLARVKRDTSIIPALL